MVVTTRKLCAAAIIAAAVAGPATGSTPCLEDEPCWSWSTMGNHKRAVKTDGGRLLVVGPCRFRRLDKAGLIDWARTGDMNGDSWARKNGCKR